MERNFMLHSVCSGLLGFILLITTLIIASVVLYKFMDRKLGKLTSTLGAIADRILAMFKLQEVNNKNMKMYDERHRSNSELAHYS